MAQTIYVHFTEFIVKFRLGENGRGDGQQMESIKLK